MLITRCAKSTTLTRTGALRLTISRTSRLLMGAWGTRRRRLITIEPELKPKKMLRDSSSNNSNNNITTPTTPRMTMIDLTVEADKLKEGDITIEIRINTMSHTILTIQCGRRPGGSLKLLECITP